MSSTERENWLASIQSTAEELAELTSDTGVDCLAWILEQHGAKSIEDLRDCELESVFNELFTEVENAR